jgi:hypothetical protein
MTKDETEPRFIKVGLDGDALAGEMDDWVAVRDRTTGLTWSRANVSDKRLTHKQAIKACAALNLAGHADWRLPTIRELLTLVDYGRYGPAIDIDLFPECKPNWYWSDTPYAPSPGDFAWYVGFYLGIAGWYGRGGSGFVRAVRASQSLADGSSLE